MSVAGHHRRLPAVLLRRLSHVSLPVTNNAPRLHGAGWTSVPVRKAPIGAYVIPAIGAPDNADVCLDLGANGRKAFAVTPHAAGPELGGWELATAGDPAG